MAPSKIEPRVHKRVLSDQQRRRDLALQRQQECRRNLQLHARRLAAGLSSGGEENEGGDEDVVEAEEFEESYEVEGEGGGGESSSTKEDLKDLGLRQGTRLKGAKAREWFSKQLMLPEWMIDIPPRLKTDWSLLLEIWIALSQQFRIL